MTEPDVSDYSGRMKAALRARDEPATRLDEVRRDLAGATRRIIDELCTTTAPEDRIAEAAELVARAADLLATQAHERPYEGPGEGSISGGRDLFIEHSPFVGPMNPLAPPMHMEMDDDVVVGRVTYGIAYEGPPGCLHGGFIAAGFDEVLGFTQGLSGRPGMTGRLDISYRSPTPLFEEVVFEGRVDRIEGRKIFTSATLKAGDRLCAEATGLFISIDPQVFGRLLVEREARREPG